MAQRIRTGDGKGWRGGEQGMTGVERGFSLGQWILKSVVSVASVYLSVSPLISHSVSPPLLFFFLIFLIPLDTGLHNLFSIFLFCLFNKFFTFLYLTLYMFFLNASNFYALIVFVLFTFSICFLPFLLFSTVARIILLFVFFSRIFSASCLNSISSISINCLCPGFKIMKHS